MGTNMISEILTSQEEQAEARKREQIRRKGHTFIKVIHTGIDRGPIHDIHDYVLDEATNPETGQTEYKARLDSVALEFRLDNMTGDKLAYVLDDEYNRFFLSRQLGDGIEIENKTIAKEIKALIGVKYKVEKTPREELLAKKRLIDEELAKMDGKAVDDDDGVEYNEDGLELDEAGEPIPPLPEPTNILKPNIETEPIPEYEITKQDKNAARIKAKRQGRRLVLPARKAKPKQKPKPVTPVPQISPLIAQNAPAIVESHSFVDPLATESGEQEPQGQENTE